MNVNSDVDIANRTCAMFCDDLTFVRRLTTSPVSRFITRIMSINNLDMSVICEIIPYASCCLKIGYKIVMGWLYYV